VPSPRWPASCRKPGERVTAENLPDDVRRLLIDKIDSVEELEVLLLLHHSPGREWTPEEVCKTLYTSQDSVRKRLLELQKEGLVASGSAAGAFQSLAAGTETSNLIEHLASVYATRRVSVIALIFSKPPDNLRALSDAFRLKKPEDK